MRMASGYRPCEHEPLVTRNNTGMPKTAVFLHAHPDDEALLTAGTMRRCVEAGIRVVLMMCTDGAAGETDPELLAAGATLADIRRKELAASAALIGVDEVCWVGFDDSGLDGKASPEGFAALPEATVAERLAELLSGYQPDLVTVYDRNGGYGHPDHVRVHTAGHRALRQITTVPEVWEATVDIDFLRTGTELVGQFGYELPEGFSGWLESDDLFLPGSEIDLRVNVTEQLAVRRGALAAHRSQSVGKDNGARMLALAAGLPDPAFGLAFGTEWYRIVGEAGPIASMMAG